MGDGDPDGYRPRYPVRDRETGETLIVVWYAHRDAPSLIPWEMPSTGDLFPAAELLLFKNRGRS